MPFDDNENGIFAKRHWTDSNFFSGNMLIDALAKHILGLAPYGMVDIGEVLEVFNNLQGSNETVWFEKWLELAKRLHARAEEAEKKGNKATAASGYLRASSYYRCALFYYSEHEDPRLKEAALACLNTYHRYLEFSGYPGEYIEFPYEDSFLPAYFYRSPVAEEKAPLLIIIPGRDTFAEDTRWVFDAALKRGIHCLVYDGPGQGLALRINGHIFRPDWENVNKPILDHVLANYGGIDESRIGLFGISFGGFLGPRVAAYDKRIKLVVTDPGNINWGGPISERLGPLGVMPLEDLPEFIRNLVKDYAWKHNIPVTIDALVEEMKKYNNTHLLDEMTCKTLVLDGTKEVTQGAKAFYDMLKCPKHYMLFDETTGSQCHSQMGGYLRASEDIFDWVCENL